MSARPVLARIALLASVSLLLVAAGPLDDPGRVQGEAPDPFPAFPWNPVGPTPDLYLGFYVAAAGDVDGDFDGDLLVATGTELADPTVALHPGSLAGPALVPTWTFTPPNGVLLVPAPAGDVNGDGYADVMIGLPYREVGGFAIRGLVYVFHGGPGGLPAVPTDSLVAPDAVAQQFFGNSLAPAGDVNGDGYADVIVGAPLHPHLALTTRGSAYVYHGGPSGLSTTPATTLEGNLQNSNFGLAVSGGDVNADGFSDVIVGAPNESNPLATSGAVWLFRGAASGVSAVPDTVIRGTVAGMQFGSALAFVGDVDGDVFGDFVAGAPGAANGGRAVIFYGTNGVLRVGTVPNSLPVANESYGSRIASLGDLDGNGHADFGVWGYGRPEATGRIAVFLGTRNGFQAIGNLLPPAGAVNFGLVSFGASGDANGDGFSEILVGDPGYDGNRGRAHLFGIPRILPRLAPGGIMNAPQAGTFYGSSLAILPQPSGSAFASLAIGDPGFDGFGRISIQSGLAIATASFEVPILFPGSSSGENRGARIVDAGDLNRDGFSDFVYSATHRDANGAFQAGEVFWVPGGQAGFLPVAQVLGGDHDFDRIGTALAGRGDVDGDGYHDFLVGARQWDGPGLPDCGKVWLVRGGPAGPTVGPWTRAGTAAGQGLGIAVALTDFDGDAYSDVVVASAVPTGGAAAGGKVEIFFGSASGPANTPGIVYTVPGAIATYGAALGAVGDVNGDRIADLAVGAPEEAGFGVVRLYAGTRGRSQGQVPMLVLRGAQAGARYGDVLAGGGDMDGDGIAEFAIGEPLFDSDSLDTGRVHLHFGAPLEPERVAAWAFTSNLNGAMFGGAIAPLRDLEGDGKADLVIGAPGALGRVYPFFGGVDTRRRPQILVGEGSARRLPPARLGSTTALGVTVPIFLGVGRTRASFQAELALQNDPFTGVATVGPFNFNDTGGPNGGTTSFTNVSHGAAGAAFTARARVVGRSPYFPRSRWFRTEAHASGDHDAWASGAVVAVAPDLAAAPRLALSAASPVRAPRAAAITLTLPEPGRVTLDVHDVRGARVRRLVDEERPAGRSSASWDGRDGAGRVVAPGVYLLRLSTPHGATAGARVVLLR